LWIFFAPAFRPDGLSGDLLPNDIPVSRFAIDIFDVAILFGSFAVSRSLPAGSP